MQVGNLNSYVQSPAIQSNQAEEIQERSQNLQLINAQSDVNNQQQIKDNAETKRAQQASQITGIGSSLNILG